VKSSFLVPRSLLLEFLGAFGREYSWIPISGLIEVLGALDLDEAGVRTSVSRLKKRGLLTPQRLGDAAGYVLSEQAVFTFESGDAIIWHAREVANLDDGWVMVAFSIPETARAKRHLLKSRLTGLGFGHVGPGMLLAPRRMADDAQRVITQLGVAEYVDVFHAQSVPGHDLVALAHRGWELQTINERYTQFIDEFSREAMRYPEAEGRDAFVAYMRVLNWWRPIPFLDPGLPPELLGPAWHGEMARLLFEGAIAALESQAHSYVRTLFSEVHSK
jgi:phenylacetic acid degradation operon negative regulatory protein